MFIKIILLYSLTQAGDISHGNALLKALSPNIVEKSVNVINADQSDEKIVQDFSEAAKTISTQQMPRNLVIAVGEKGGHALESVSNKKLINPNVSYVYWGIHQYVDKIKAHRSLFLDHLMVPAATVDTPEKKESLLSIPFVTQTFAVPSSNPSIDDLKRSYEQWSEPLKTSLSLDQKYLIVMLPGDAPDSENQMHFFTRESARDLFLIVHKYWKDDGGKKKILVQNGPRTGKHDPRTGVVVCPHEFKTGHSPTLAIDDVSKYFLSLLSESRIPVFFTNFAFEINGTQRSVHSAFNPLLYLAYKTESPFIFPGESVSMMGQLPLYLDPRHVIAFRSSSMNQSHEKILRDAFGRSFVSQFTQEGKILLPLRPAKRHRDEATEVSDAIIRGMQFKFTL